MRRSLGEEWKARRVAHVAAITANTNWDSKENDRSGALEKLEHFYESQIAKIWNADGDPSEEQVAEDEAWDSPFMRAGRAQLANQMAQVRPPVLPGESAIGALP